jgi:hypothetical protein
LLALVIPLFASLPDASAQGYVVRNWQSPTYGFTIDYRSDAFRFDSETTENGVDTLVLTSDAGWFSVQAMPATMTADECVQAVVDEVAKEVGTHDLQAPIANGTGLVRSYHTDERGVYTDNALRIDCGFAQDSAYLVRFMHFAVSSEYGFFEVAARDIRASYRPGYPPNNPLPANIVDPDGTLEVAVTPLDEAIPSPSDLASIYQPTRLLTVEFIFTNVSQVNALLETARIVIAGGGPSISHVWINNGTLFYDESITVVPGSGVVGHLTFAIPATVTTVTFCYQHITDANCTELLVYEIGGVYGGGPSSRPRIDPGA